MSNFLNDAFCIAPWVHMHIEPDGNVQLCCASSWKHEHQRSLGNLNHDDPLDIWNNNQYKLVRKNMMAGKKIPQYCSPCYDREAAKINQTERQRLNSDFSFSHHFVTDTLPDGTLPYLKIKYLDIRFNNLCNLKCRTCGPDWSTSWANELGIEKPLLYNNSWKKILPYLAELEKVYFAGGEPLMTPEHYDFLEHLIDINTNIELLYTSNFSRLELKGKHVLDYWPKFKLVSAIASVDHYGEYAAYVRTGSDYELIKRNIQEIQRSGFSNIQPAITSVYSLYNATRLGDFIIRLFEDGIIQNMNQIVFNILVNPDYQMANIMPTSALNVAIENTQIGIDYLKSRGENPQKLESAIEWLISNHKYDKIKFDKFVGYNKKLDAIRGTSFDKMYPELSGDFNE
jgi:radical SAM protein with 4Fe4S-binding SPASM domain